MTRGDILLVDLGAGVGRELGGPCPVVVVSNDILNSVPWMIVVVPGVDPTTTPGNVGVLVTASHSAYSTDLVFLSFNVRALDPTRFPAQSVGRMPAAQLAMLDTELRRALQL